MFCFYGMKCAIEIKTPCPVAPFVWLSVQVVGQVCAAQRVREGAGLWTCWFGLKHVIWVGGRFRAGNDASEWDHIRSRLQHPQVGTTQLLIFKVSRGRSWMLFWSKTQVDMFYQGLYGSTEQTGLPPSIGSWVTFKSHESPVTNRLQPCLMPHDHQDKYLW